MFESELKYFVKIKATKVDLMKADIKLNQSDLNNLNRRNSFFQRF